MRQLNNLVLIKPNLGHYSHITIAGGVTLFLDQSWEKEQHACSSGTIVGLPDKIKYPKPYNGKLEVEVGDEVIFNYLDHSNAVSNGMITADGNMWLPYDFLYLAIRKGEVKMLNGFVVVEGIPNTDNTSPGGIILPEMVKKTTEASGIVRYIGEPLDDGFDYETIKVGDKVVFADHHSIPLQFQMHQIIDKDKTLYRMRYSDILAVVAA